MILVETEHVEDLLRYILSIAPGMPVIVLRDRGRRRIYVLTELGSEPLIFTSRMPEDLAGGAAEVYRELERASYVYLDEKGRLVFSPTPPERTEAMRTGIGVVLDVELVVAGEEAAKALAAPR